MSIAKGTVLKISPIRGLSDSIVTDGAEMIRWWAAGIFDFDDRLRQLSDLGYQIDAFRAAVFAL